ncbi:MAG: HIT family protein [Candidatus Liptonbacteria bacterium]|nr:HIT family protein [Candidatus Liptonbacteria bacterium]
MDQGCLFCKIANKKIGANIVYEDNDAVAFLDIHPRAPGHAIVIPRHHAGKIAELPDEVVWPLFLAVKRVAKLLEQTISPDGLTIGINQGEASGQEVAHLHIHILPRFSKDGGGSFQSIVNNPPKESTEEVAEKVKNQLLTSK